MKKVCRLIAWIICAVLVVNTMLGSNIMSVSAEGENVDVTFTLSIGMADGSTAPQNYGISYTVMEADGTSPAKDSTDHQIQGAVSGGSSQTFTVNIPSNYKIRIEINAAGNDIIIGGADVTSEWANGKLFSISDISGKAIEAQLRNNSGGNQNPGNGHGDVKIIEFPGATISNGKATYQVGDGESATQVTVEVVVNDVQTNISTGAHQEVSLDNSSTAKLKLENFDPDTMQVVLRGTNNYQHILIVTEGMASLAGLNFPSPANLSVELKNNNNPPGPGGEGPGGEQGGNWINLSGDEKVTVSFTGSISGLNIAGNGIDVTNNTSPIVLDKIKLNSDNKMEISVYSDPTIIFTSLFINDTQYVQKGDAKDHYEISLPGDTKIININASTASNDNDFTIVWTYKLDPNLGPECLVEHGKVEMVSGYKSGNDSYYIVEKDSTVTVKLIPDYGYQVVGARLNGDVDLSPDDNNTSQFTFQMPSRPIHFQGIFTPTSDVVANTSTVASSASISNGAAVAGDGGTAKLSVSNANPATQANTIVKEEVDSTKDIKAVDIGVSQIFYKNRADSYWENTKSELSTPAQINLKVDNSAVDYAVVRTHDSEVTEIASSYNKATGTLTFASDKFSTYTLVPLSVSDEPVEESKPQSKPAEISGASRADEQFEQQVRTEELLDIQIVKTDKTQVEAAVDAFVPDKSYNMSAYKTARGFIAGLNKIAKNNRGAKSVSIYTGNPICFNKGIINAITKNKIDVVYYFIHKGHLYSVTIPAGTDLNRVLEHNGFAGPLYVGKVLGTSRLIK